MINERKFGDASERGSSGRREDTIGAGAAAFLGGSFIGAILGGSIVWFLRSFLAGDEPPIRVKGGSLHLDIICGTSVWEEDCDEEKEECDGKNWKFSSGTRNKDDYDVSIDSSSSTCVHKNVKGKWVRIEYTEGLITRSVELKSAGKKTKVKASDKLLLAENGKRLMFDTKGYISKIDVEGKVCTFASKAELDHAILMDL